MILLFSKINSTKSRFYRHERVQRRQRRRYGVHEELQVAPKGNRFHNSGQRRTTGVRHQALRGVHGRSQVPRLHQQKYAITIRFVKKYNRPLFWPPLYIPLDHRIQ